MKAVYKNPYHSIRNVIELLKPPEKLTVTEAAEKYRIVYNPKGYQGPYKSDITPYCREPTDILTSRDYRGLAFVAPAQCGKTANFVCNWALYNAVIEPADMQIYQTCQFRAQEFSNTDLSRMIRYSPKLNSFLRPGKSSNNIYSKKFKAGNYLSLGWPSENQVSGKTVPKLVTTDYDRIVDDIGGDGNFFDLSSKRQTTFGTQGMCAVESSPSKPVLDTKWKPGKEHPHEAPPSLGIFAIYNRGDRRIFYWPCQGCGEYFIPSFSMLEIRLESGDNMTRSKSVYLPCHKCGFEHRNVMGDEKKNEKDHKYDLNLFGVWVGEGQSVGPAEIKIKNKKAVFVRKGELSGERKKSLIASFWLKGPCAAFLSWPDLMCKHLDAEDEYAKTGSEESLKTTINVDQCEPYFPKSSATDLSVQQLMDRAKDLGDRVVPPFVRYLIATIDVQNTHFPVQVEGFGPTEDREGLQSAIIDRFNIVKSDMRKDEEDDRLPINPAAYPEDWETLIDRVITKKYPLDDESCRLMKLRLVLCDSGGSKGVTPNAYNFWRSLKKDKKKRGLHEKFLLVKGYGKKDLDATSVKKYPEASEKSKYADARGDVPVLFIRTNEVKDSVMNSLEREEPGNGFIHFPDTLPENFYKELLAEERINDVWKNVNRLRNESFDLCGYARGGNHYLKVHKINWNKPPRWAKEWDKNSLVVDDVEEDIKPRKAYSFSTPKPMTSSDPYLS